MCFRVIGILLWFQKSDVGIPMHQVLVLLLGVSLCSTFLVTVVEVTRPIPEIRIQGFSATSSSFSCQLELPTVGVVGDDTVVPAVGIESAAVIT